MTAPPRWYRPRIPPGLVRFAWWAVVVLALLLALEFVRRQEVRRIRADERAAVLRQSGAFLDSMQGIRTRIWAARFDSLRRATARVETVLVARTAAARAEASAPLPPLTDTLATARALRRCRQALDTLAGDCEAFRVAAMERFAADSARHLADAATIDQAGQHAAAWERMATAAERQLAGRDRFRWFERGVCLGSLAANVLQARR